jgi:hypothetical protein
MVPNQSAEEREEDVPFQLAYLKLARRLRELNQPILGLWPIPESLDFQVVPRQLALALASLGGTVGLVASPEHWKESDLMLSKSPLADGVDLLTPRVVIKSNPGSTIEQMLSLVHDGYTSILLDLAGMDLLGVYEVTRVPCVGIVLFIRRSFYTTFRLARIQRRLPSERLRGAVLVDMAKGKKDRAE